MYRSVFTAYVLSVIADNKICVRVDRQYIQMMSNLYSDLSMKNIVRDTITINVKNASFDISVPWSDLNSLIGMHIKINSSNNKYSFWDKREYTDENGVVFKNSIRRKGITFHAKTIKNITIDDE